VGLPAKTSTTDTAIQRSNGPAQAPVVQFNPESHGDAATPELAIQAALATEWSVVESN
jgi:hypothetical protein